MRPLLVLLSVGVVWGQGLPFGSVPSANTGAGINITISTTATQALLSYTAPDANPCTIRLSEQQSLTPSALDVDATVFTNSNTDTLRSSTYVNGTARVVVLGQRAYQFATAGATSGVRHYSRALQANTHHYGNLICGAIDQPFEFTTQNIPLGQTYGEQYPYDPSHPGDQPFPEYLGGTTKASFIDAQTGTFHEQVGVRGNNWGFWSGVQFTTGFNQGLAACAAGAWTNPCGTVVGGAGTTSIGASQTPLVLRLPLTGTFPWTGGLVSNNYSGAWTLDQLGLNGVGTCSSSMGFCQLDFAISFNNGASRANYTSSIQTVTIPASGAFTVGQADKTKLGTIPWLLDTNPRFNGQESAPNSGGGTISGSTLTWTSGINYWSSYWTQGGNGRINIAVSPNNACTSGSEYTITSFTDGTHMVLSPAPPTGAVNWCELNFTIMIWRHLAPSDGSTIQLTTPLQLSAIESSYPTYPDNGVANACMSQTYDNGYFCMYGGLMHIRPDGTNSFFGYMVVNSPAIGVNTWHNIGIIPAGEASNIDVTQSKLTFYTVSYDPTGGGPLVIRGTFDPGSVTQPLVAQNGGAQIQNATVTGTSTYGVTYSNSLVFTNLTPQSLNKTVVQQMATLQPAFNPLVCSTNGWNLSPYGMTGGVFYFTCLSSNANSAGWVFGFCPGDGDPTHAGLIGGPRICGAISTYNTPTGVVGTTQPAFIGHSLHAVAEADNGWVGINGHWGPNDNNAAPVTTTTMSVPASSSNCSTFSGGASITGTCLTIQLDVHGGAYEPYIKTPFSPFVGTPGELRTTQIGDIFCIYQSTSTCSVPGKEWMTLVTKNYNGTPGLILAKRNAYGTQGAICAGAPCGITLSWGSPEILLTASSTTASSPGGPAITNYWNPLTGCSGAPDPLGNCLQQDTNETFSHLFMLQAAGAATTNTGTWNVAEWGQFPNVYQTVQGTVPTTISYAPANVTPGAVAQVKYTNYSSAFAGTYGHPWVGEAGAHPNAAGNTQAYAFDNTPYQGSSSFYYPTFSAVTGQVYVTTPASVTDADDFFGTGGIPHINRKLMAQCMSCGTHPLVDVSGPGVTLGTTSTDSYKYCITRVANECRAGSTVGQVYVNCPNLVRLGCSGSAIHGGYPLGPANDICIGNQGIANNAIREFSLNNTDQNGVYTRTLSTATNYLRMVYGFENNRLTPDNSWLLYRSEWLNYNRPEMWAMKMLPRPSTDGNNRATFLPFPVAVSSPPLGTDNVDVIFGYQEYGAPSHFYCTSRAEQCAANAASVPAGNQPFKFSLTDTWSGLSCAVSCTIMVPALSQRVLYYAIEYRDAGGVLISTSPTMAAVQP